MTPMRRSLGGMVSFLLALTLVAASDATAQTTPSGGEDGEGSPVVLDDVVVTSEGYALALAELNEDPEIVQSSLLRDVVSAGLKDLAEGWEQRPTLPDILSPDWVDSLDEADMEFVDGYLRGIDFIATNHRVVWTPTGLFVFID